MRSSLTCLALSRIDVSSSNQLGGGVTKHGQQWQTFLFHISHKYPYALSV